VNKQKRYKENDWMVKHARYLDLWNNHQRMDPEDGSGWRPGPHREYMRWYHTSTRTKIKAALTDEHIEDAPSDSDDDIADEYDNLTRVGTQPERAPLHDYLVNLSHANVV
jgi:hypothetical protein